MLRISDGRMSGTAGGTIVLHVSPESAIVDSVFGVIEDGGMIEFNMERRSIELMVPEEVIAQRKAAKAASPGQISVGKARKTARGYRGPYERCMNQADHGCDFDFLTTSGSSES